MNSDFQKGLKKGLILYGVGAFLTFVFHLIFGWDYGHAPPPSFIVILITFLIGLVRFFITLNGTFSHGSLKSKGEFYVHSVVALIVIGLRVWLGYY